MDGNTFSWADEVFAEKHGMENINVQVESTNANPDQRSDGNIRNRFRRTIRTTPTGFRRRFGTLLTGLATNDDPDSINYGYNAAHPPRREASTTRNRELLSLEAKRIEATKSATSKNGNCYHGVVIRNPQSIDSSADRIRELLSFDCSIGIEVLKSADIHAPELADSGGKTENDLHFSTIRVDDVIRFGPDLLSTFTPPRLLLKSLLSQIRNYQISDVTDTLLLMGSETKTNMAIFDWRTDTVYYARVSSSAKTMVYAFLSSVTAGTKISTDTKNFGLYRIYPSDRIMGFVFPGQGIEVFDEPESKDASLIDTPYVLCSSPLEGIMITLSANVKTRIASESVPYGWIPSTKSLQLPWFYPPVTNINLHLRDDNLLHTLHGNVKFHNAARARFDRPRFLSNPYPRKEFTVDKKLSSGTSWVLKRSNPPRTILNYEHLVTHSDLDCLALGIPFGLQDNKTFTGDVKVVGVIPPYDKGRYVLDRPPGTKKNVITLSSNLAAPMGVLLCYHPEFGNDLEVIPILPYLIPGECYSSYSLRSLCPVYDQWLYNATKEWQEYDTAMLTERYDQDRIDWVGLKTSNIPYDLLFDATMNRVHLWPRVKLDTSVRFSFDYYLNSDPSIQTKNLSGSYKCKPTFGIFKHLPHHNLSIYPCGHFASAWDPNGHLHTCHN